MRDLTKTVYALRKKLAIVIAGDLISSNNLSDLTKKYTAFDNLSVHGADKASAGTLNLETATGNVVDVTGTTSITAITLSEGHERTVKFTGSLTLTGGASLILPGGGNIQTAAGDIVVLRGYAAGVVRCISYQRLTALPVSGTNTGDQTLPVKATGTEINTGTDDAKFATAKAIEDSDYAKTAAIPVKATGAEANTGTDDAKFLTPKAIEDSDYAKTAAITIAQAQAGSSITPCADNTYANPTSITTVKGIITAIS